MTKRFKITFTCINPQGILDEPEVHERSFPDSDGITAEFWAEDWAYGYSDKGGYKIEEIKW